MVRKQRKPYKWQAKKQAESNPSKKKRKCHEKKMNLPQPQESNLEQSIDHEEEGPEVQSWQLTPEVHISNERGPNNNDLYVNLERNDAKFNQARQIEARVQSERALLIRQVLFAPTQNKDFINNTKFLERKQQRQSLQDFLTQQSHQEEKMSDVLYIYGSPGTGKTFIVKSILKELDLLEKTRWVNCLSLRTNLAQQLKEQPEDGSTRLIVFDEFDQVSRGAFTGQSHTKMAQYLRKQVRMLQEGGQIIMISNKPSQTVGVEMIREVVDLMGGKRYTQLPFLPYLVKEVKAILSRRVKQINERLAFEPFEDNFVEMAIRKVYTQSQDLRQVLDFMVKSYEEKRGILALVNLEQRSSNDDILQSTIKSMGYNDQALFKVMLEKVAQKDQQEPFLLSQLYKIGRRLKIHHHKIALLLHQWKEQGLVITRHVSLEFKPIWPRQVEIVPNLQLSQCVRWFY